MTQTRTRSQFAIVFTSFLCVPFLTAGTVVSAGSSTAQVGEIFTLPVSIANATDVFAFQFDIAFDPAILQLLTVSEGGFLGTAGTTIFAPGTIDNTAGTATFTADTLSGPVPGASGRGVLADFTLQAISLGTSAVIVSNVILLDSSLGDIPLTTVNGRVLVTPEPMGLPWLGTAVFAGLLWAKKRIRNVRKAA